MPTKRVKIFREGSMCFIPVPFDSKVVFGKARAPVRVTLNQFTYRSTIAIMDGVAAVPLRKSNREAAGLMGGETLPVTFELDTEPRDVHPPEDLRRALQKSPAGWEGWTALSYTHRREQVEAIEQARKPETRARRIAKAVRMAEEKATARRGVREATNRGARARSSEG